MRVLQKAYLTGKLKASYQGRSTGSEASAGRQPYDLDITEGRIEVDQVYTHWSQAPHPERYSEKALTLPEELICRMPPLEGEAEGALYKVRYHKTGYQNLILHGIYEDASHRLGTLEADVMLEAEFESEDGRPEPEPSSASEPEPKSEEQADGPAPEKEGATDTGSSFWSTPKAARPSPRQRRQQQDWARWGYSPPAGTGARKASATSWYFKPLSWTYSGLSWVFLTGYSAFLLWTVWPSALVLLGFGGLFLVLWGAGQLIAWLLGRALGFTLWGAVSLLFLLWAIGMATAPDSPRLKRDDTEEQTTPPEQAVEELPKPDPYASEWITHRRRWVDCGGARFEATLRVRRREALQARTYRNQLRAQDYSTMFDELAHQDTLGLKPLINTLDSLRKARRLGPVATARMVVSLIQDIPYTLIVDGDCEQARQDPRLAQILDQGSPCVGGQRYGILAPAEFVATLAGDCDTRTLLLYTVLHHMGYEVAVFSSEYYGHSVLGLRLPGQRGALLDADTRAPFLFCETTTQLPLGFCPPELDNLSRFHREPLTSTARLLTPSLRPTF